MNGTILVKKQGYYHGRIVKINVKYLLHCFKLFSTQFLIEILTAIDCAPIETISDEKKQFYGFLFVILMYPD